MALPPRPTPDQAAELARRQRGRNLALILALGGFVLLFFAISFVKMAHPH